jgi:K+-transporting ATPase ATPase A chain
MSSAIIYSVTLVGLVTILGIPLGRYLARVFEGGRTFMTPLVRPIEALIYRVCGVKEQEEQSWQGYSVSLVLFTLVSIALLFLLQLAQRFLPLNPQHFGPVRWDTAINTAISFTTNTNWQAYSGETTMSYLTQMLGLTVQNFVSAAAGIAALVATVRGFSRKEMKTIGNFWVDLVRSTLYVLVPLAVVLAVVLVSQGVVQNLRPYATAQTLEGGRQTIAVGPAASQIAIKQLGNNGGGFFNANSAHPFENPNWLTNFFEILAELLIPVALLFMFGIMVRDRRQGWTINLAMLVLFALGLWVAFSAERAGNPMLSRLGVLAGQNMQGKETRFGVLNSVFFGQVTTVTSTGAVNSMHDSMMPLTGLVYMFNMGIGEAIFGGVGAGLLGMFFYIVMTMFIAGLMIGRTPEYLGKKLGSWEMIMAVIGLLLPHFLLLGGAAIAVITKPGLAGPGNPGAHGLSEVLYAFCSAQGNNGSAFGGLNANTPFYNITLGFAMLFGRLATLVPALAIGGAVAGRKTVPASAATFPSTGLLFVVLLVTVVLVVGALTFFPAFALGPVLEHLMLR